MAAASTGMCTSLRELPECVRLGLSLPSACAPVGCACHCIACFCTPTLALWSWWHAVCSAGCTACHHLYYAKLLQQHSQWASTKRAGTVLPLCALAGTCVVDTLASVKCESDCPDVSSVASCSIAVLQEMLNFCGEKHITADVEVRRGCRRDVVGCLLYMSRGRRRKRTWHQHACTCYQTAPVVLGLSLGASGGMLMATLPPSLYTCPTPGVPQANLA